MTINEVITKHYQEFRSMVKTPDVVVVDSKTLEDVFQEVMITAIRKFKDNVDEDEAFEYIKRTLLTEFHFSYKRKKRDMLIFTDEPIG